jgi:16S rRNA (uracil1498-N3)-methyltransferase
LPSPVFIAWESERRVRLRDALPDSARAIAIVIGPEGGIADDEIALGRDRGAVTVTLGGRNLRSETAAIAAVALVMDRLE